MTRTKQFTMGIVTGITLFGLSATPLVARHFKELSDFHTIFGVSQFNALDLDFQTELVLYNPNHVTQVAAVLLYERSFMNFGTGGNQEIVLDSTDDFPPERYFGCMVTKLTPHAAVELDWDSLINLGETYAEVIWAPEDPVRVAIAALGGQRKSRRLADGLGGQVQGDDEEDSRGYHLVHPGLFSLPDETVDFEFDASKNQQEATIECVCQGLFNLAGPPFENPVSLRVFETFGINCP